MSPVIEAKLESISDNIVAEIFDRFKDNVKIYEIQNIVEHELLEANEYAIAQEYIIIVQNAILRALKRQISTFLLINC